MSWKVPQHAPLLQRDWLQVAHDSNYLSWVIHLSKQPAGVVSYSNVDAGVNIDLWLSVSWRKGLRC